MLKTFRRCLEYGPPHTRTPGVLHTAHLWVILNQFSTAESTVIYSLKWHWRVIVSTEGQAFRGWQCHQQASKCDQKLHQFSQARSVLSCISTQGSACLPALLWKLSQASLFRLSITSSRGCSQSSGHANKFIALKAVFESIPRYDRWPPSRWGSEAVSICKWTSCYRSFVLQLLLCMRLIVWLKSKSIQEQPPCSFTLLWPSKCWCVYPSAVP